MKTKTEIIEETAHFYSEDVGRRSLTRYGGCSYLNDEGNMCAVGRCFTEEGLKEFCNYGNIFTRDMFPYLKEDYRIENYLFWFDLQQFHDNNLNWNEDGLSERGKEQYKLLLEKYGEKNEN